MVGDIAVLTDHFLPKTSQRDVATKNRWGKAASHFMNVAQHAANIRLHANLPPEWSEVVVWDIAPTHRCIVTKNGTLWDIVRVKAPSREWPLAEPAVRQDAVRISREPAYRDESDAERVPSPRHVLRFYSRTSQSHLEKIARQHPSYG